MAFNTALQKKIHLIKNFKILKDNIKSIKQ